MATMQEYLEEMARRQATGWTPGVPNRFAVPVSTTWNLPSTARTTMRQAVPKANLGDISAQSNPQPTAKRRGRPRTTPEKLQSISDRAGTGTIKPMLGAISKIAGPAGIAAELLRSEPAVASELAPGTIPGDFRVTQAYPSMAVEEGYPNVSTLPSFDVLSEAGSAWDAAGGTDTPPSMYPNQIGITDPYAGQAAMPTLSVDSWSPNWDTMENMYAEVGGIPSGRQLSPTADTPYAGPSRTVVAPDYSISQDVQRDADINDVYRHAGMVYGPTDMGSAFGPFGDPVTGLENWRPSDLARLAPFDTVRDTILSYHDSPGNVAANQDNLGPSEIEQQLRDLVNNTVFQDLRDSGTPLATAVQSPNVVWDVSAGPMSRQAGAMPSMIGNNMGAMARLVMDDYYAPQNVSINNLAGTGPSLFDSISEVANQVDTFSSPLANPNITAQATIDDYTAALAASDPALQGITPFSMASTSPAIQAAPQSSGGGGGASRPQASAPMAPRQDAMPVAPSGPTQAEIEAQIAAAEQSHRDQQASARQALRDFYGSRAYQQEGASAPAGLIDMATEVDSFADIAEQGGGYQGGYEGMGGFEGYR